MADPWAVASQTASKAAKEPADPWAVSRVDLPPGVEGISARPRTAVERFADNFGEGQRTSLLGAFADMAGTAGGDPYLRSAYKAKLTDRAQAYEQASDADRWYRAPPRGLDAITPKVEAGLATLLGNVAGGAGSPESVVGWESGLLKLGGKQALKETAKQVGKAGAKNFAAGAAADVPTQLMQNEAGTHEGFDPWRPVVAGAGNALLPIGAAAAGHLARGGATVARGAADAASRGLRTARDATANALDNLGPIPSRSLDAGGAWDVASTTPAQAAPTSPVAAMVHAEASRQGVDPNVALTIAQLESPGLRTDAKNPVSSAAGLYQFTDKTWSAMGGGDKLDPALNAQRGVSLLRQNADALSKDLGRPPEGWELYLAHQQGAGGAAALLRAGDTPAIDALKAAGVSPKRATASILQNGGRVDMSAAEFADLWRSKYLKAGGSAGAMPNAPPLPTEAASGSPQPGDTFARTREAAPTALDEFATPASRQQGAGAPGTARATYDSFTLSDALGPAGPLGPSDRPAAQRGGPQTPGSGVFPPARSATGSEFLDESHARLYELGRKANEGHLDTPEASELARSMGPLMDWTDEEFSQRERHDWRNSGVIHPRRMIETAKEFVRQVDAPENRGSPVSFYDPDAYGRAMGTYTRPNYAPPPSFPTSLGGDNTALSRAGANDPWNPIPTDATPRPPSVPKVVTPSRDLTDEALDVIRRGGKVRETRPSLLEYLAEIGVRDDQGELAHVGLDRWHMDKAFRRKVVRPAGRTLEDAAISAQEMGYLPEKHGADVDTRATPRELLEAIREELAGRPRYATDAVESDALRQHVDDVEEILAHLGIDPHAHSNADIKAKIDAAFSAPEERVASRLGMAARRVVDRNQQQLPGLSPGNKTAEALAQEIRRRDSRRGSDVMPEGSLFDEVRRHEQSLFDAPQGGKLGAIDLSQYQGQIAASAASRNIGGLRAAPRPGAIPTGKGEEYAGATITRLAEQLRKSLGITHRQGRMTLKGGAVGEYDPKTAVIRTKAVQEMDVLAHEATHALEYKGGAALTAALKKHAAELKALAYPGANKSHLRQEGFAEFGRWYLTNPDHARKVAPNFYEAFEAALFKDNPAALRDLMDIQAAYKNLLMSSSVDVAAGSVAYTGRSGSLSRAAEALKDQGIGGVATDLADRAWTWFVDDLHPLNVAVRRLQELYAVNHGGQRLDLKSAGNPYALARLAREAYSAGHLDITEGVVPHGGIDPEGPSLSQALEHALGKKALGKWSQKDLSEFDAYLISRRMVHEWDRYNRGELPNPPDKTNGRPFHEQVIHDLEAAHPTWKDAASLVYDWNEALWKKRYEAGLITQEAHDHGLKTHPDYVPLLRDVSDKQPAGALNRPRGSMQFAGGAKQFKGSTRDVISPLSSMMREAYELNGLIKRNETIKALDDLAEAAGPGAGAIVERLPAHEVEAINVDAVEALAKAAHAAGLSERDITSITQAAETALGDQTQATIFRHRDISPKKGEAVVFAWRDGKKRPLLLADGEFGQDMFTAISGMNRDMRNALVDAMAGISSLLRHGVTLSPEFMSRNIVRDQLSVWINTDVGYVPGVHYLKGAAEQLRHGAFAKRNMAVGGMRGGMNTEALRKPFPRDDNEARAQLQKLRHSGMRIREFNPVQKNPLRALAALTDLSEAGTRLGVLKLAFDKAKRQGLTDAEAMVEAGLTSRDYMDFGLHGSKMISAARILTFMNASIQGLMKASRVLSGSGLDRPNLAAMRRVLAPFGKGAPQTAAERQALSLAYKAWAKVAALAIFGGALRALYADDPEYQEIGDKLRATHWFFRAFGKWVGIPKPFEYAEPGNIVERLYERTVLNDPSATERMWSDFRQTIAPPYENPLVSTAFGIARNRDYNDRPIVPDHLVGTVDPALQFNSYTSELGKRIGAALHVSPAVVDYVVTNMGGSVGRYGLQAGNLASDAAAHRPTMASGPEDMFVARGFVRDVARGSASQKRFWDLVSKSGGKLTEAEGSFRHYMDAGQDAQAAKYLNHLDPSARAYVVAKVFTHGGQSMLHPLVRAQKVVSIIGDIRQEVRDGSITTQTGHPINLTPEQRRDADDALSHLAMVEMRNALVLSHQKGWTQKDLMARKEAMEKLDAASPQLAPLLRWTEGAEHVPPAGKAMPYWLPLREQWEQPVDPDRLTQMMNAKRLRSSNRMDRHYEIERQLRQAGRLPPTQAEAMAAAR